MKFGLPPADSHKHKLETVMYAREYKLFIFESFHGTDSLLTDTFPKEGATDFV